MGGLRQRIVEPEWWYHWPPEDPAARRSRADLRRINAVMGNERRILRILARHPEAVREGVWEWGGGDGNLAARIARWQPQVRVTVCDLAPRPAGLAGEEWARIEWRQGDLFGQEVPERGGVLLANLFLHHFEEPELRRLGGWCGAFRLLVFNEPDRSPLAARFGALCHPLLHPVTRHDMQVSIRAGFRAGEMAGLLGLEESDWEITEASSLLGARWLVARRRQARL